MAADYGVLQIQRILVVGARMEPPSLSGSNLRAGQLERLTDSRPRTLIAWELRDLPEPNIRVSAKGKNGLTCPYDPEGKNHLWHRSGEASPCSGGDAGIGRSC
jgi:hypothetical protein